MSNIVARRIEECKKCPELTRFRTCNQCGCFMPVKTRIKSASCPLGKWGSVPEQLTEQIPQIVEALNNAPVRGTDD